MFPVTLFRYPNSVASMVVTPMNRLASMIPVPALTMLAPLPTVIVAVIFAPDATESNVGELPVLSSRHAGFPETSVFQTLFACPLPLATMPAEL